MSVEGLSIELSGPLPKIKEGSPIDFNIKEIKEKDFKPLPPPNFHALKVESRLSDILLNDGMKCSDVLMEKQFSIDHIDGLIIRGDFVVCHLSLSPRS